MSPAAPRDVRLVALVCLTLLLVSAAPVVADAPAGRSGESGALRLLERAAAAAREVGYSGTQYVASWSTAASSTTLAEVAHDPAEGTVVTRPSSAGPADDQVAPDGATAGLEAQVLDALARQYDLRVAGAGRCAGRTADLVEARRPGARGTGAVAGRFWLDRDSGLLLRREVYDERGRAVRSSAFLDLDVRAAPSPAPSRTAAPALLLLSRPTPTPDPLARVRRLGWDAPQELPGGFRVFDARLRDGDRRVQLSYSDGLSTLSLFAQHGELGDGPGGAFTRTTMDGARVWRSTSVPERVVWSGGGQVWTLVADAPPAAVRDAVRALPHDPEPRGGVLGRLGRGLQRMGRMANPFD